MSNELSFKKGKTPREELELPTLHFVVTDQWLDVIEEKALLAWLRMYSWCDRDIETTDNLWEQAKVPTSFTKLRKKLGVGNDTFYNKILKPLWNVGLIDIEEFEGSQNIGQKPMNIIVYKYPQNRKELSFAKLKEIRNYDTDYHSQARIFSKLGGRPKKEQPLKKEINIVVNPFDPSYLGGVLVQNRGCSRSEQGGVLVQNRGVFSFRTGGCSEIEHNNIFNSFNNSLNSFINTLNNINKSLNSSSIKDKSLNIVIDSNNEKEEEENKNEFQINSFVVSFLKDDMNYSDYMIKDIIKHMKENKIDSFTKEQIRTQHKRMVKWVQDNKKDITSIGYFFVNGILKHDFSSGVLGHQKEIKEASGASEVDYNPYIQYPSFDWLNKMNKG